jgi:hypothetical protein
VKEQVALKERQDILDYRLFDRAFDSVVVTSAYKMTARNAMDQGKVKYAQFGKGFLYSNLYDGDEAGWRPPKHTGHPPPSAQFSGKYSVQAYRWDDGTADLQNAINAVVTSSYVGAAFFMDARKDTSAGTWNIAVNNENLRVDGRYDVEKKTRHINSALLPILNFSYDNVEYTYEYEFY